MAEAPFGGLNIYAYVCNCVSSPCVKSSLNYFDDNEDDEECEVRVGRLLGLILHGKVKCSPHDGTD